MMAKKVLFITQEIVPYVEESEMSNIGKQIIISAQESGHEVRTFMPKWGQVNERRNQLHEVIRLSGMNLIINDTDHPLILKVASMQQTRLQVYFIDNDDYFSRRLMADDATGKEYDDNVERTVFYARGVLETVKKLRWCPDVIVCQGWMGSMVPFYIKTAYKDEPSFSNTKVVYMACAKQLTKELDKDFMDVIYHKNISPEQMNEISQEALESSDLSKLAASFSDGIILASKDIPEKTAESLRNAGKPLMECPDTLEEFLSSCEEFYGKVCEE